LKEKTDLQKVFEYCKRYYSHHEKFPKIEKIIEYTKLPKGRVVILLRLLEERGNVKRNYSYYHFPGTLKKDRIKEEENNKETKTESNISVSKFDKIKLIVIKFIMCVLAIIGTYTSIFFTYLWFLDMFTVFKSFMLSIFIVGSSITFFEMSIMCKADNKKVLFYFFGVLWLGIVLFSISTGVSGQLSSEIRKQIKRDESNLKDDSKVLLFQDYNNRISNLKIDLNSSRKERDKLQEFLLNSNYDTTDDRRLYRSIDYKLKNKNKDIENIKKELKNLESEKEKLLKNNVKISVTKEVDFFNWLENIFGVKADKFRFILYLILACFVDIISPINFSVVLFYKNKGVDNERNKIQSLG
jgi:hypothetical protein